MGAMPGNRERKDCQTDVEGVKGRDGKQTEWGDVRRSQGDKAFAGNRAHRKSTSVKSQREGIAAEY